MRTIIFLKLSTWQRQFFFYFFCTSILPSQGSKQKNCSSRTSKRKHFQFKIDGATWTNFFGEHGVRIWTSSSFTIHWQFLSVLKQYTKLTVFPSNRIVVLNWRLVCSDFVELCVLQRNQKLDCFLREKFATSKTVTLLKEALMQNANELNADNYFFETLDMTKTIFFLLFCTSILPSQGSKQKNCSSRTSKRKHFQFKIDGATWTNFFGEHGVRIWTSSSFTIHWQFLSVLKQYTKLTVFPSNRIVVLNWRLVCSDFDRRSRLSFLERRSVGFSATLLFFKKPP